MFSSLKIIQFKKFLHEKRLCDLDHHLGCNLDCVLDSNLDYTLDSYLKTKPLIYILVPLGGSGIRTYDMQPKSIANTKK